MPRDRPPRPRRGSSGETADQRRRRLRKETAVEQERRALELFVQGKTYRAIGEQLDVSYQTAWNYVKRGLARRAEQDGEIAGRARAFLQLQIEALMGTWMPRALDGRVDENGEKIAPDPRAADIMHKYIRQYAEITGALAPVRVEGDITTRPADPDAAVDAIMGMLARAADKDRTIDGALASVGHTQHELTTGERSDALPPPIQDEDRA